MSLVTVLSPCSVLWFCACVVEDCPRGGGTFLSALRSHGSASVLFAVCLLIGRLMGRRHVSQCRNLRARHRVHQLVAPCTFWRRNWSAPATDEVTLASAAPKQCATQCALKLRGRELNPILPRTRTLRARHCCTASENVITLYAPRSWQTCPSRSNDTRRPPQEHQWSGGKIHRRHRCDPGSIPG